MIKFENYFASFKQYFKEENIKTWDFIKNIEQITAYKVIQLDSDYFLKDGVAIHRTAKIENNVNIKAPAIIGKECFIGANTYLRNGVFLTEKVCIGTGCEIKSSIIFRNSSISHFNFIGDSLIGENVNFEAGSITANHYNERENKEIVVKFENILERTGLIKFGSIVGDFCKIGANAVLSPGTILSKNTTVKRLELVEQV